jgi:hypothetical protein
MALIQTTRTSRKVTRAKINPVTLRMHSFPGDPKMASIKKTVAKAAKAVRNKVAPKKTSKLKTAGKVAAVAAAVVGAGLATRAYLKRKKK